MGNRLGDKIDKFFESMTKSKEEHQRLLVYLLGVLAGIIGYPLHILGLWGSDDNVLQGISVFTEVFLIVNLALYLKRKITLYNAFAAYGYVMEVVQSLKIMYIAHNPLLNGRFLILFNFFICLLVIFIMVMGFMHYIPMYLTAICCLTSIAVNILHPGAVQKQFVFFFAFISILDCGLGILAWRNLHDVENENKDLHKEETDLLKVFNMNRNELLTYLAMSKSKKQTDEDVHAFFDKLDESTERNIINAVKVREAAKKLKNANLAKTFPQLSPTECDVCRLIINGKTIKEIARMTGKTVNNVSAVRIHIRKKLNLSPDEDLRETLMKKMGK